MSKKDFDNLDKNNMDNQDNIDHQELKNNSQENINKFEEFKDNITKLIANNYLIYEKTIKIKEELSNSENFLELEKQIDQLINENYAKQGFIKNSNITDIKNELKKYQDMASQYAQTIINISNNEKITIENIKNKCINSFIEFLKQIKFFYPQIQDENMINTLKILENQLFNNLYKDFNILKKEIKENEEFNPQYHIAVSIEYTDNKDLDNKIFKVLADLILQDNKIIQFAQVIVYKLKDNL